MDIDKVEIAKKKVEAANLRVLAASQRMLAAAHRQQATRPIYPGQETICLGKANQVAAFAARSEARAELAEAEAG